MNLTSNVHRKTILHLNCYLISAPQRRTRKEMTTGEPEAMAMDPTAVEKAINEEYKIWKKNSPFLYECVSVCSSLGVISLTCSCI